MLEIKVDLISGGKTGPKSCKTPVRSSPPTKQHPKFYRPDVLPVAQPTVSEHCCCCGNSQCNAVLVVNVMYKSQPAAVAASCRTVLDWFYTMFTKRTLISLPIPWEYLQFMMSCRSLLQFSFTQQLSNDSRYVSYVNALPWETEGRKLQLNGVF